MEVRAPDGTEWHVARKWLPYLEGRGLRARQAWWRRRRPHPDLDRAAGWVDLPSDLTWLVIVVVGVLAITALFLFGVPLVLALVDLVVVAVLTAFGLFSHEVLRRPWTVRATSSEGARLTRPVVGFRAAGRAVEVWAEELRHGRGLEPPVA